jgi:hypothetical protein
MGMTTQLVTISSTESNTNGPLTAMILISFLVDRKKIVSTILYYHKFGKNVVDGRPMCDRGRFLMARLILTLIKLVGVVMLVSLADNSFWLPPLF